MTDDKSRKRLSLIALLVVCFAVNVNAQERRLKIYISADMEGVVGVVTGEQLGPQGLNINASVSS